MSLKIKFHRIFLVNDKISQQEEKMKNFKKQHWVFSIIFCVFFLFISSCAPEAGVEKKVESLLKADDYTSALELLNEGIKKYPERPSLRALKVKVLAKMGKFIEAHEEYFRFYNFTKKHDPKLLYELALSSLMAAYYDELSSKLRVAFILAEVGDKGAIDMLKEFLKIESVGLRSAELLARFGDESGIGVIKEALDSKYEWERWRAAVALTSLGSKDLRAILKEALKNKYSKTRWEAGEYSQSIWEAAEALVKLGDKSGMDFLKKHLEDGNPRAALYLAKLGDKSGMDFLKKALEDEREGWYEAAIALARIGDKSAIPILTKLLKERGIELYKASLEDFNCLILSLCKLTK